jgi:hypothetical protein
MVSSSPSALSFAKSFLRSKFFRATTIASVCWFSTEARAGRPLDFLQPQPRQLSEVAMGEYAFINFTEVSVDLEGRAWVDTTAPIREEVTFMCVKVRPEQGGYHLTLFKRRQEPPPRYTP